MNTHTQLTAAGLLLAAMAALPAQAQTNGTWITAGGGTYSTGTNWQDSTVAGGGGSADFSTVDIPVGASTVTWDAATSLGSLTFGDSNTATAGTWAMAGTAGLTLTGATPTITTNVNTAINAGFILAGTSGFTKEGTGQLTVFSNAFTLSGPINLNAGTLAINRIGGTGSASANVGTGQINMANGTTLRLDSAGSTFVSNAVSLANGAAVNFSSANTANGYSGLVTGDATSKITTSAGTVSFSANALQLTNMLGTVEIASGTGIRFSSSNAAFTNGGANTTFNVLGTLTSRNSGTLTLGALTGSGTVSMGTAGANNAALTYNIGGKNIDSVFSGVISDGDSINGKRVVINKLGTGKLTLSGASTYTGATNINGGSLLITGSLANTTVTVGASGTLGGTGSIAGATTINGALRPNTAPINNTSRLTFASGLTLAGTSVTTFDIDGANFTGVTLSTAESLTYNGALSISFTGTAIPGTYDLFNFTDTNTGSFTGVSISGSYSIPVMNNNSGIWTGTSDGFDFTFTQSSGDLLISAVPEPSAFALLAGLAGIGYVGLRRRRRA
jgi:autotransporter-associated beta strand protein